MEKITVAIPAPVSDLTQWIGAFVTLGENTFQNLQTLQPKNRTISKMCSAYKINQTSTFTYHEKFCFS